MLWLLVAMVTFGPCLGSVQAAEGPGLKPAAQVVKSDVATEEPSQDEKVVEKTVTGEVVYISKRSISVEYAKKESGSYEMLLPVDGETKFERVKGLQELHRGDVVRVAYEQRYRDVDEGEAVILGTVARVVSLQKSSTKRGTP